MANTAALTRYRALSSIKNIDQWLEISDAVIALADQSSETRFTAVLQTEPDIPRNSSYGVYVRINDCETAMERPRSLAPGRNIIFRSKHISANDLGVFKPESCANQELNSHYLKGQQK